MADTNEKNMIPENGKDRSAEDRPGRVTAPMNTDIIMIIA